MIIKIIAAKIDVTKIDKARLFEGKNGARYLDVVLIETPTSKYGDFMICQSVSKEERAAGKRGAILGNGKYIAGRNTPPLGDKAPYDTGDPYHAQGDVPF